MAVETRIAHIADPHLPFGLPSGVEWFGKRGLSGLSWLLRRRHKHREDVAEALLSDMLSHNHDLIAMAGDLVNFGLAREFAAGRTWLERLGPPERVIAIPGNHEALAGRWQDTLQRHWGNYDATGRIVAVGAVALIAVSSAVVTPPGFASGRVGADGLRKLAAQLAEARQRGLLPVVLIHHPPTPIAIARKALSDLRETAEVIATGGAALVLHGHTHCRDLSWIDGSRGGSSARIPVLGAPSLSMAPGTHQDPGAWRSLRIWREGENAGVEICEHRITETLQVAARTPFQLALPVLA